MVTRLKDGTTTEDPRLGRLVQFDERSREYPAIRTLTSAQQRTPRTWTWTCTVYADQLQEGSCVGHSISHELAARPVIVQGINHEYAQNLYYDAQRADPWPGGEYPGANPAYSGTSVLAGIKVAQDRGFYSGYSWAFSEEELMLAISWKGPTVLGIVWYDNMYQPDSQGLIRPTGTVVGGHAILCNGFSVKNQMYRLHNSWGPNWGVKGDCFISRTDMAAWLQQDGECVLPNRTSKATV